MTPEIAAKAVRRKREVVVKADRKAAIAGALLRIPELDVDLPLHVLIKQNTSPVFA